MQCATPFLSLVCELARNSCHCETCRIHGAAISLPTDRHTTFAMTILILSLRWSEKIFLRSLNVSLPRATLVAWWKQSAYKQHLFLDYFATLVMPKKTRWPRGLKPLAMTIFLHLLAVLARNSCHCETCRIHGVAISLPKDRHTPFAMTKYLYTCCKGVITSSIVFCHIFYFLKSPHSIT